MDRSWLAHLVLGVASILHRDTIAVIVGSRTFERGEKCFAQGRVLHVEAARGELRGAVKPQETGRAMYAVRIWVRDDGLAYECSCPIGKERQFCKHAVAIALAHLQREREEADRLARLRDRLLAAPSDLLIDTLVQRARHDPALFDTLNQLGAELAEDDA